MTNTLPAALPAAPAWTLRRASLRPACRLVQRRPDYMRRAAEGAAFVAAVCAACLSILALGAWLDA